MVFFSFVQLNLFIFILIYFVCLFLASNISHASRFTLDSLSFPLIFTYSYPIHQKSLSFSNIPFFHLRLLFPSRLLLSDLKDGVYEEYKITVFIL